LSCESDWQLRSSLPEDVPLGQFAQVIFLVDEHMRQSFTKEEYFRLLELWKANDEFWFTRIELFQIRGSENWEDAFMEFVEGLTLRHTHGVEVKAETVALTNT
jgi:hypothetical protein